MPIPVIIDLVIAAVLGYCVVTGVRRGLFRSLMGVAVVAAALFIAASVARRGADIVVEDYLRPVTMAAVEEQVDQMLLENAGLLTPLEEMEQMVEAIPNGVVREAAQRLLEGWGLSGETLRRSSREALLAAGESVVDAALDGAVRNLVYALLYFLAFSLASMVLRRGVSAVNKAFRLPLLKQVNQAGGLLFGAVKGGLLVCRRGVAPGLSGPVGHAGEHPGLLSAAVCGRVGGPVPRRPGVTRKIFNLFISDPADSDITIGRPSGRGPARVPERAFKYPWRDKRYAAYTLFQM